MQLILKLIKKALLSSPFKEMTKATRERLIKEMQNWRNIGSRSDHLKKLRAETTLSFEALEFGMETTSTRVL